MFFNTTTTTSHIRCHKYREVFIYFVILYCQYMILFEVSTTQNKQYTDYQPNNIIYYFYKGLYFLEQNDIFAEKQPLWNTYKEKLPLSEKKIYSSY